MAAIMDEWAKIAHQVRRLAGSLGIEYPNTLDRLQGDLFARQSIRLNAVAGFLQDVNERVEAQKIEAQANFEAGNAFDEEGESVTIEEMEADLGPVVVDVGEIDPAFIFEAETPKTKRRPKKS